MNRQKDTNVSRLRAVGSKVEASAAKLSSYFVDEVGWAFPALGPVAVGVFSLLGSTGVALAFDFWALDDFLLSFGDGGLRSSWMHSS